VASWPTIRLILMMSILSCWHTRQIDYVLAYTQADAETDNLYMKIPKGFELIGGDDSDKDYVLKIRKNIYGQKQAGRVWNKHLVERLKSVGFTQSAIDECVFYRGKSIYVLYTDDSILAGPDSNELDQIIADMKAAKLDLTVEGDICDFLGVRIARDPDGTVHLTQPHLIDRILKDLRLDKDNVATKQTPAPVSTLLSRHSDSESFDGHFDYRSVVGKLNYLEKSTRPDISYAVHQCARFASDPKKEHGKAVTWIGRYLAATRDKGLVFKPTEQSFDCYVDADFSGNWDKQEAPSDSDTARSRTGYVIHYAGCPIVWASKLQTQIALSTTEAEYIALSTALRETIPLMELVRELHDNGFNFTATTPTIHCKVFEDNSGAVEIATVHKMRPRTKHINTQYHHFRQYVQDGKISIVPISTENQRADILTKSLPMPLLVKHRRDIMGW
jgi:Reverse transcriptase (RNA-dependent DNA polymerase)